MNFVSSAAVSQFWDGVTSSWFARGESAGYIRGQQIGAIARLSPYMMTANAICATLVMSIFWNSEHQIFLMFWSLIIPFALWTAIKTSKKRYNPQERRTASERGIRRAIKLAFCMGLFWGSLPVVLFPDASNSEQIFLTCLAAGMLCGTGFALATIPPAAAAAVVPIALGSALALALDQNQLWIVDSLMLLVYAAGILLTAILHGRLFISQLLAQEKVAHQSDTIRLLLREFEDNSSDWLWETDSEGRLVNVPSRMIEVFGQERATLVTKSLMELLPVQAEDICGQSRRSVTRLNFALSRHESFRDLTVQTTIKGETKWLSFSGRPVLDAKGSFSGYRGVGSDVTSEKLVEACLEHLARYDSLTGVANRMYFRQMLDGALGSAEKAGRNIAVIGVDLDEFKIVNDTRGHPFGDALLRAVANRLVRCVNNQGVVARVGGDEFVILHHSDNQPQDALALADTLVSAFHEPFEIDDAKIEIGTSIGICIAPTDGQDVDTVMKDADLALFAAKNAGGDQCRLYEAEMGQHLRLSRSREVDLKKALEHDELRLYYQPLVNSSDGAIVGFETLMRWCHPVHGIISPAEFIPIAERIGEIETLGSWAIQQACHTAAQWPEDLSVAINLSPLQFQSGEICNVVGDALKNTGISPARLELEITEGVLMRNTNDVLDQLATLKGLGVTIALDDFGTGYSSLSYLWRFPFDKIKIDQSFVSALGSGSGVEEILRSILLLARSLNARVVAEGVETEEQARHLNELGCNRLQGYLFGRPKPDYENSLMLLKQRGLDRTIKESRTAAASVQLTA